MVASFCVSTETYADLSRGDTGRSGAGAGGGGDDGALEFPDGRGRAEEDGLGGLLADGGEDGRGRAEEDGLGGVLAAGGDKRRRRDAEGDGTGSIGGTRAGRQASRQASKQANSDSNAPVHQQWATTGTDVATTSTSTSTSTHTHTHTHTRTRDRTPTPAHRPSSSHRSFHATARRHDQHEPPTDPIDRALHKYMLIRRLSSRKGRSIGGAGNVCVACGGG